MRLTESWPEWDLNSGPLQLENITTIHNAQFIYIIYIHVSTKGN